MTFARVERTDLVNAGDKQRVNCKECGRDYTLKDVFEYSSEILEDTDDDPCSCTTLVHYIHALERDSKA